MDERFQRTDASGARTYLTDALGSTLALTDSSGAVQTQYTYDPFGGSSSSGAASSNSFQFTGRENDGTALNLSSSTMRAAWFSPRPVKAASLRA